MTVRGPFGPSFFFKPGLFPGDPRAQRKVRQLMCSSARLVKGQEGFERLWARSAETATLNCPKVQRSASAMGSQSWTIFLAKDRASCMRLVEVSKV